MMNNNKLVLVLLVVVATLSSSTIAAFAPAPSSCRSVTFKPARIVKGIRPPTPMTKHTNTMSIIRQMSEEQEGEKPAAPTSGTYYDDEVWFLFLIGFEIGFRSPVEAIQLTS